MDFRLLVLDDLSTAFSADFRLILVKFDKELGAGGLANAGLH